MYLLYPIDGSILIACQILIGLVFSQALYEKIKSRKEFVGVVANYKVVPDIFVPAAAWLVLFLELSAVLMLIYPGSMRVGAIVAATLLSLFTASIVVNIIRGRNEIDCGCFYGGVGVKQRLSFSLVVKNIALIIFCVPLIISSEHNIVSGHYFYGFVSGLVLFVLYQVAIQIIILTEKFESIRR